jgi:mono/diheme cytochrome c family protein
MSLPLQFALGAVLSLTMALLVDGCRSPASAPLVPHYALNEAAIADNPDLASSAEGREALERALVETFGTPSEPRYLVLESWREEGFDPNRWTPVGDGELAHEERPPLAESAALFRSRCALCHGTSGGGDGMMAQSLHTKPRDYRRGVFKKTPLTGRARPRHEDLLRTLNEGIATTAMPSWEGIFSRAELAGLVDIVRLLAIRGETERMAVFDYDTDEGLDPDDFRASYELAVQRWRTGGDQLITPGPPPASTPERIAHGKALFHGSRGAACVRCHGSEGHGDGVFARQTDPVTGELVPFRDEWGNAIQPRDLVCDSLRFGDRLEDIYRRIHSGINGTPMPAHDGLLVVEADGTEHTLGSDDIWDLVLYVSSLKR